MDWFRNNCTPIDFISLKRCDDADYKIPDGIKANLTVVDTPAIILMEHSYAKAPSSKSEDRNDDKKHSDYSADGSESDCSNWSDDVRNDDSKYSTDHEEDYESDGYFPITKSRKRVKTILDSDSEPELKKDEPAAVATHEISQDLNLIHFDDNDLLTDHYVEIVTSTSLPVMKLRRRVIFKVESDSDTEQMKKDKPAADDNDDVPSATHEVISNEEFESLPKMSRIVKQEDANDVAHFALPATADEENLLRFDLKQTIRTFKEKVNEFTARFAERSLANGKFQCRRCGKTYGSNDARLRHEQGTPSRPTWCGQ